MKNSYYLYVLWMIGIFIFFTGAEETLAKSKHPTKEMFNGIVTTCHDGDTCRVKISENQIWKVRVAGIDAPEIKQPFGKESQAHLENLIKNKPVQLECSGMSFDRHTCRILMGTIDIGQQMVQSGMAWEAPQYSKKMYAKSMVEARDNKRGLWGEPSSLSPYCFRRPTSKHCRLQKDYMP